MTLLNEHERRYRNAACLCYRPYLYKRDDEQGVWRCYRCGGIKYAFNHSAPPTTNNDDELHQAQKTIQWLAWTLIATIALLVLTIYLYDTQTEMLNNLIKEANP